MSHSWIGKFLSELARPAMKWFFEGSHFSFSRIAPVYVGWYKLPIYVLFVHIIVDNMGSLII